MARVFAQFSTHAPDMSMLATETPTAQVVSLSRQREEEGAVCPSAIYLEIAFSLVSVVCQTIASHCRSTS